MKSAIIFSGQGAQNVGMVNGIEEFDSAMKLFQAAEEIADIALLELCKNGPLDQLNQTVAAQPALYTQGYALFSALNERINLCPAFCAGLSLGEFTAHAAAGSVSFVDGLKLVAERARAMQAACGLTLGGMTSLIGADHEQAESIAKQVDVDVANYNSPGQIVLSGALENLSHVPEIAKTAGIKRAIPLKVSGAFHSRLMQPAANRLREALESTHWQKPSSPIVANVTAQPCDDPLQFTDLLSRQVTSSVRWDDSIRMMRDAGVKLFLEIGPGQVLAGLNKRIDPDLQTISLSDFSALNEVSEQMRSYLK